MKKTILKAKPYVACAVAFLILISSLSSALFLIVSAQQSREILSHELPLAYYSADEDGFTINENKLRYGDRHVSEAELGYDEDNLDTSEFWETYTGGFTDGDADAGALLNPSNTNDRVVLIYKFSSHTINKVELSFGSNRRKNFSVYLSEDRKSVFSEKAVYTSSNKFTYDYTADIGDISASYIGIVFDNPNYELFDIKLYGIKNEVLTTGDNVLKNLTPYMYASANEGSFTYCWNMTHYGPSDSEKMHGYSDPSASNKPNWDEYTKAFTDADTQNGLYIKNENINNCKRVIAIYELDKNYDINSFKITAETDKKWISVYLGDSIESLFSDLPLYSFKNNVDEVIIEGCDKKKIKYIGFVFDMPDYTIYELEAYGTEYIAPQITDSIIKDKTPTRFITAANGSFGWNWHQSYYGSGATDEYYGYNESYPEWKTSWGDRNPEGWDKYTKYITDGDTGTPFLLKPELSSDNLILVYTFDDYIISGFNMETSSSSKTFSVYVSKSSGSLFSGNPIYQVNNSTQTTYDLIDIEERVSYIGIVFKAPNTTLFEFSVFGTKYQRPNYGTDLTDNGELVGLYTANRGYPVTPIGYEFLDNTKTQNELKNLMDNSFSTGVSWTPWYAKEKTSPSDPYIVFIVGLKYESKIDKILIDSSVGGLDIFVSDKQAGIFEDINNRVYSSGGDNYTLNGAAFDASYDMPSGENLIDIDDVDARFVGFVVTRSTKTGSSNYGTVSINEVQIFGTATEQDYGENILLGKTPIMTYRASHDDYRTSLGTYASNESDSMFTDGKSNQTYYQFPNNGGKASYGYGALVMIYYLEGTIDINHISFISGNHYYNIGGLTMYAATSFEELFNDESCIYDTYGYRNNDEVYDPTYDVSCMRVNTYHEEETLGRYLAIVCTRPHPSVIRGWGMVRINEIEVYGNVKTSENLPDTQIKDPKTGATIDFAFQNPDEKFEFVKLGIKKFSFETVKSAMTDEVYMALSNYNYRNESEPFKIVFYDSKGKVFDNSKLDGMKLDLRIPQKDGKYYYLGELDNNMIYSCDRAVRINDMLLVTNLDNLNKVFIYLSEGQPTKLVIPEFDKPLDDSDDTFQDAFINNNNNTNYVPPIDNNTIQGGEDNQIDAETNKKPSGGRQWVEVKIDDPLEWFWNIYDTFAQNIWMLVMCIIVLVLGIVLTVLNIIYSIKKRRNVL